MGHPPKQLIIGIPSPSFDGKYWGRWPLGNKPQGAVMAGGAVAAASSVSSLLTAIRLAGSSASVATGGGLLSASGLPLLFTDPFESGDLSHTENGISWGAAANVAVSTQNSNGGTRSARFSFIPASSTAELRFDLGRTYSEFACLFDLYIPNGLESYGGAAYTHGTLNPSNNKMFRLWRGNKLADPVNDPDGYGNYYSKYGASFERGSTSGGMSQSNLQAEYGQNSSGMGPFGSSGSGTQAAGSNDFISIADRGTWITPLIYCKAATAANNDGTIQISKNGILKISSTNLPSFPDAGAAFAGFDFGYLLGFANAGWAATTYMFIDNVKIYGR